MLEILVNNELNKLPLVYGMFSDDFEVDLPLEIKDYVLNLVNKKEISLCVGALNKIYTFDKISNEKVYIVGLGKKSEYTKEKLVKAVKQITPKLGEEVVVVFDSFKRQLCSNCTAFHMILTIATYNYKFEDCFGKEKKKEEKDFVVRIYTNEKIEEKVLEAFNLATSINNAKDLVNSPYNYLNAEGLANYAKSLVESLESDKVSIKVFNKNEIEELGMNAFLGVNKGSKDEPKLIYIKYQGLEQWSNPIALVGKGLMFDTGGYSIKSSTGMPNMKDDMSGAATVIGTLEALVKNNVKANVIIVVAATDNRINGGALLPDDVLTAMNGKTIEIVSTDAEGRLTLADAVCFAQKEGSKEVIDVATLTGACVAALGEYITGVFGNDQENIDAFMEVSKKAQEDTWQLPITDYVRKLTRDSKVADFSNSTKGKMGASGAAAFIEGFIEEGTKWIHLDIAGTAFHTAPLEGEAYGATGVMIKTLYKYIKK